MTPKILNVDDSKTVRTSLARLFARFACEWREAANGEEGLAAALSETPDLILSDLNMPVMDGITMIRKMREHPALKRTPVIMLSTESGQQHVAAAARLGVRDYVIKPFKEEELLAKVGRIIPLVPQVATTSTSVGDSTSTDEHANRADSSSHTPPNPAGAAGGVSLEQSAILVVDDSRTMRLALISALNELGLRNITEAANGRMALDLVQARPFDLMLLDIEMPEMSGTEVLNALKTNPDLSGLPVIVISGSDQMENAVKCIELGAEDFLPKPFNPTLLRARVTTCLEKKRLRDLDRLRMAELARAHELVRRAFGRYVSEEVAASILQSPEGLELGGEEREVTILMSDLRGFTALAARLTPHEVIEFLNLYLEAMVDVISRYEGTIDEIIGDAILVIFGAPLACEDHADKAVACGLAMQLAMKEVNQRLVEKGASELEMGIGIHTGRVIVGNIGSLRRTKYAAVGSNVNLAGRIESFTTGGQILISESVRGKIKSPLRLDAQFQVEPKGAKEKLQLHEVGGIGEPFSLSLPSKASVLLPLAQPLPIHFTVLEEKFVGRTVHEGRLVAVSETEAGIESQLALVPLSNLKIELEPVAGANPGGEIYAKVIGAVAGASAQTRIRFTSVSPELKIWVQQATARLASASAAKS
ncbi:MAG: response regulator [Verrucomicrobia bacterium]|nr:response regulator [Verrucomicrobiota bacterium]